MPGTGTFVNIIAIIIGCSIGIFLKGGIPDRIKYIITSAIGLSTIFIGIAGAMEGLLFIEEGSLISGNSMVLIASMIIGGIAGELIDIEQKLDGLGEFFQKKLMREGDKSSFVEGFVSSSLVFCVGAMAIVGSLDDGLMHDYSTLFSKSVMDGIMSMVFGASLGVGVYLSAVSVAVYQGSITLLAGFIRPYLSEVLIERIGFVGSVLIFCVGVNFIFGKKVKTGNLLPAIFVPVIFSLLGI